MEITYFNTYNLFNCNIYNINIRIFFDILKGI